MCSGRVSGSCSKCGTHRATLLENLVISHEWGNDRIVCITTLEKTERVIKNGQSRDTDNIGYARHRTKTNKAKHTTQKTKTIGSTDLTKIRVWTQVLVKGKQFLIRQPPSYSYIQSSLIKVFAVIEERKHLRKR